MNLGYLLGAVLRVAVSVVCAGVFYVGWMAVFIPAFKTGSVVLRGIGWLSAPVVTAAGFATGIAICEYLARTRRTDLLRMFRWPLIGCALGAGAVFPFGPMLIVFGMFAAGTASVALREVVLGVNKDGS